MIKQRINNVFLIENHDEALKIWRRGEVRNLDLVHIDAHMDFGFYRAKPIEEVVRQARSIKDLKTGLEYSLAFSQYEKDFNKQVNIGNYIYPAMNEGIVKDFYWVIPGTLKEFEESLHLIKNILKYLFRQDAYAIGACRLRPQSSDLGFSSGMISTVFLGRKFVICILDNLPVFEDEVLLDIDTDFLVIDSLKNANNTSMIGKRKPWILPEMLAGILKRRIRNSVVTTIAYSVNGGYTPLRYKHFADVLANSLSEKREMDSLYRKRLKSAEYFNLFEATGKRVYYQKAIQLNPSYRIMDNNYGPLYLSLGKLSKAEREFKKIASVDCSNPYPFIGLGYISLKRRDYERAKSFFNLALKRKKDLPEAVLGLAQAMFYLKDYSLSKKLFSKYQEQKPMQPQSYYFLGRIYEREKRFTEAIIQYRHVLKLGVNNIDIILRLLRIALRVGLNDDIIKFIIARYNEFKRRFKRSKKQALYRKKRLMGLKRIEKKLMRVEEIIKESEKCRRSRF